MTLKSTSKIYSGCRVRYHGRNYTVGACVEEADGTLSWHLLGGGKRIPKGLGSIQVELWVNETELRKAKR